MTETEMKISYSTNGFIEYSVFEAIERIADIGYEGVELLADSPHLYADYLSTQDLEKLKGFIGRTELKVANINPNTAMGWYGRDFWEPLFEPSLANPDKELRHWRVEYSKKCVDLADWVGADCISVTSGRCAPDFDPKTSMGFLLESLRELVEYAEERSIRIGIEYEPGLLVERYEELAIVLEKLPSRWLGANLDLGHSHVLGEDPARVIESLGHKIFHVHLEDIRDRKHYHLVPGTGDMNFPELLRILCNSGYSGFATVELYTYLRCPEEVARQALKFLTDIRIDGQNER